MFVLVTGIGMARHYCLVGESVHGGSAVLAIVLPSSERGIR